MFSNVVYPRNEPDSLLELGSPFRTVLKKSLDKAKSSVIQVPLVINGKHIFTNSKYVQVMPSSHSTKLAECSLASSEDVRNAIQGALDAKHSWERLSVDQRCSVFLKAAELLSGKYRADMLAATMLGQGKNYYQADIDSVCELIDFIKFNVAYAKAISKDGVMLKQSNGIVNTVGFRPLEGFVATITPFNFTAIGGNLSTAPTMIGNTVVWKPSNTALLSNWLFYQILLEAGLPPGVIQFVPADGPLFGKEVCDSKDLAAINFTGSTATFEHLWREVGKSISLYREYPRMVGECGGKNFHVVHESADLKNAVNCTIRAAFEYSGQKCSACSRLYVSDKIWPEFKKLLLEGVKNLKVGQPDDYETFVSAVIDKTSFEKIKSYVDYAKSDPELSVLVGGTYDDSKGYFIHPTVVQSKNPRNKLILEEIFGPVLTVYVYESSNWDKLLVEVASSSKYSLTGSIFCKDPYFIKAAEDALYHACGNVYINDKSTGAVIGHQPFGGARKSGTNDKAGMATYLLRFASPRTRKESFISCDDYLYSDMKQ